MSPIAGRTASTYLDIGHQIKKSIFHFSICIISLLILFLIPNTKASLENNESQEGSLSVTNTVDDYSYIVYRNSFTAFSAIPSGFDLYIEAYYDSSYSDQVGQSRLRGDGEIEVFVIDGYNLQSNTEYFGKVKRESGSGDYYVEADYSGELNVGIISNANFKEHDIVDCFTVYLTAGRPYQFNIINTIEDADYSLYIIDGTEAAELLKFNTNKDIQRTTTNL